MKLTKTIFGVAVFVSWALLTAIFVVGFQSINSGQGNTTSADGSTISQIGGGTVVLTAAEVAKHNSASSCWMIINNKVYDVTTYVNMHPGGASTVLEACGKDGTALYDTKGSRNRPHSSYADSLLKLFYVGDLNQAIGNSSSANNSISSANVSLPPTQVPPVPPAQQPAVNDVVLSAAEVAAHNSASDCWTIVNGNVYDITSYINMHPGGAATILEICGTDGTALFVNQPHSQTASNILDSFYVGILNQNVSQSALTTATQTIANTTVPTSGRRGREYEDD